jgi:hypothetical protein
LGIDRVLLVECKIVLPRKTSKTINICCPHLLFSKHLSGLLAGLLNVSGKSFGQLRRSHCNVHLLHSAAICMASEKSMKVIENPWKNIIENIE